MIHLACYLLCNKTPKTLWPKLAATSADVIPHSWDGLRRDAGVWFSPSPCGLPVTFIYTLSPSGLQHGSQAPVWPWELPRVQKQELPGPAGPCQSCQASFHHILQFQAGLVRSQELHSGGQVTRGHTTTLIFHGIYAFSICRAMWSDGFHYVSLVTSGQFLGSP